MVETTAHPTAMFTSDAHLPAYSVIIIGYGNDWRGDDAAGRRAADWLATLQLPGVQVLSVHQLVPEHAALLASADMAIFIDADLSGCQSVRVTHLTPGATWSAMGHATAPEGLLSLTSAVYGQSPQSWLIHIPTIDCSPGASLSLHTQEAIARAVEIAQSLIVQDHQEPIRIT